MTNKKITIQEQESGCDKHLFIPDLMGFAKVFDAGPNWIEYEEPDGTRWKNGI
jgi:hypothetical protein